MSGCLRSDPVCPGTVCPGAVPVTMQISMLADTKRLNFRPLKITVHPVP